MQPSLRLLPVEPHRLYAYWTVAVAGQLRLSTIAGDLLTEVAVSPEEQGRFFDLPAPVAEVIATLASASLDGGQVGSAPLRLPAGQPQGSMVVWGRADGGAMPNPTPRTTGHPAYFAPRSSAGSHLHSAGARAWTNTGATSPGNSWRRP